MPTLKSYGEEMFKRFLASIVLAILPATFSLAQDAVSGRHDRSGPFAWEEAKDPASGWTTWTLRFEGEGSNPTPMILRLCPDAGANVYSFRFGDVELLRSPAELKGLATGGGGIPILYPTPNRVRGGRFTFEGRDFVFRDDGQNSIHGLVLRAPWRSEPPVFEGEKPVRAVSIKDVDRLRARFAAL